MFKSAKSKIGLGIIIFGIISIIITQLANNGTSFGQSLLIAVVFFVIGAVLIIPGRKQKGSDPSTTEAFNYTQLSPGKVMIYPGSKVYHTNAFCSNSYEEPLVMSEVEAQAAGFRKCKKCEKYDEI